MALINCPECQAEISDKAATCIKCGCPIAAPQPQSRLAQPQASAGTSEPIIVKAAKSRGAYIILGLLFGGLGLHNFYAGQNSRGAIKCGLLFLTLLIDLSTGFYTGFSVVWMVVSWLVTLWEIITTKNDSSGAKMT